MDRMKAYIKLMALIGQAQQDDEYHAKAAQDHSQRHDQLQEQKRAERAAAARAAANSNPSG